MSLNFYEFTFLADELREVLNDPNVKAFKVSVSPDRYGKMQIEAFPTDENYVNLFAEQTNGASGSSLSSDALGVRAAATTISGGSVSGCPYPPGCPPGR